MTGTTVDPDPLPNDAERRALCELLAAALVEIRSVAGGGHKGVDAVQAHDLAYAFHNLPREMYGWGTWSIAGFRGRLVHYQRKYPGGTDFVKMLDKIFGR
jgi:hypothetical protein